ncbi:polyphosphate kinase 2 family protein [Nonomuraea recticatena]|uniref:polyphosphate kinase 2 n=1 Tax=Nonomuraea recticatena TaxID=46178 RepID=UPI003612EF7A
MGDVVHETDKADDGGLLAAGRLGKAVVASSELLKDLSQLRVIDDDDDDPVLVDRVGNAVDTWREHYPYDSRMDRDEYARIKRQLQIELVKLQYWIKDNGVRLVILFEGATPRARAARSSASRSISTRVAPPWSRWTSRARARAPSGTSSATSPTCPRREMVFFDRSWYNRAGVERVMGFCTAAQYLQFLRQAPMLEQMLVEDGIHLIKFWFSVSRGEQLTRFIIRGIDPVRRWKLSPMDLASRQKWDEYTEAKEDMFLHTDTDHAPWVVIKSNDKKRARIEAIRHVLSRFDYDGKNHDVVGVPDPLIIRTAADVLEEDRSPDSRGEENL